LVVALAAVTACGIVAWKTMRSSVPEPEPTHHDAVASSANATAQLPLPSRVVLRPFGEGLPTQGQWRDGFDVADVNGDGHADLVHGPPRKGRETAPTIFLGDGRGTWHPWKEAVFPPLPYDYGAARVADFDGDGNRDVALAVHLRGVAVLLGDGHGRFRAAEGLPLLAPTPKAAPPFSSRALAVADWNGDGRSDLLALGDGPRPSMNRNDVDALGLRIYTYAEGRFRERSTDPDRLVFGDSVSTGDVDGDGRLDAVTASNRQGYDRIVFHRDRVEALQPLPLQAAVRAVAVHDKTIFASWVASVDGGMRVGVGAWSRTGEGKWDHRSIHEEAGLDDVTAIDVGDLDGDARRDLVLGRSDGRILLFFGRADGGFDVDGALPVSEARRGCACSALRLVDVDGDARPELVATFAGESSAANPSCDSGGAIEVSKFEPRSIKEVSP
jgi:hypothetical protein